jgi:hypothetical protein
MAWKRLKLSVLVLGLAVLATFNPAMVSSLQKATIFVWTLFVFYTIHLLTQALHFLEKLLSSRQRPN